MATNVRIIKCNSKDITPDEILESGEYFSGTIFHDNLKNSWTAFNLVNKEKMSYILDAINFNKGVQIEIFSYAKYPKDVQQESNWRDLI